MELVMWQQNLDEDHDDANDSQSTYEDQNKTSMQFLWLKFLPVSQRNVWETAITGSLELPFEASKESVVVLLMQKRKWVAIV